MHRILAAVGVFGLATTGALSAQSSEFGIRGLGLPGREESTRSLALGGASGLFDGESSVNPAALGSLALTTSVFTSTSTLRSTTNPAGSLDSRDARFPQIMVGGPIPRRHLAIGVSYSMYADRDFTVVSNGVESPRDVPVVVHDTLSSRGGIDDLRLAGAWIVNSHLSVGAAFHFLTGSNRLASRRYWEDTTYLSPQQTAELSYAATGVSIGALWQPKTGFEIAGAFRRDGALSVNRDSTGVGTLLVSNTQVGVVSLPTTLSLGVRWAESRRLSLTAGTIVRNWSVADSGLVAQGAVGARNTVELAAGAEYFRDAKRSSKLPVRLGVRYASLPFLLVAGPQPKEYDFSAGTGFRFAADRGGFDLALERVYRSQGSDYTESAFQFTIGVTIRTGGITP